MQTELKLHDINSLRGNQTAPAPTHDGRLLKSSSADIVNPWAGVTKDSIRMLCRYDDSTITLVHWPCKNDPATAFAVSLADEPSNPMHLRLLEGFLKRNNRRTQFLRRGDDWYLVHGMRETKGGPYVAASLSVKMTPMEQDEARASFLVHHSLYTDKAVSKLEDLFMKTAVLMAVDRVASRKRGSDDADE